MQLRYHILLHTATPCACTDFLQLYHTSCYTALGVLLAQEEACRPLATIHEKLNLEDLDRGRHNIFILIQSNFLY